MDQQLTQRSRRILSAIFPIGVVLLVVWVIFHVAAIVVGDELSIVSAVLGLVSSVILIVTGWTYRRAIRER